MLKAGISGEIKFKPEFINEPGWFWGSRQRLRGYDNLPSFSPSNFGKVEYKKPVVVIYNPNSGKKKDVTQDVLEALKNGSISYEVHTTKGYLDAFDYVKQLEIDKYSAIVAVGGDGTVHEVINGMMFRQDKKKIPLAFVPNGSGNDTCWSLGIPSLDAALSYIKKGKTLKVDLNKVLIDC